MVFSFGRDAALRFSVPPLRHSRHEVGQGDLCGLVVVGVSCKVDLWCLGWCVVVANLWRCLLKLNTKMRNFLACSRKNMPMSAHFVRF